ncbi:MAG: hypothetical protein QME16_04045, partial [Planctomycetota bacterium]|nr:hypothetical protein [Planctomycetota bacterium]
MKRILIIIGFLSLLLLVIFFTVELVQYVSATSRMKELSEQLEEKITRWEKKEYPREPLSGQAILANAAYFYQLAEKEIVSYDDGWSELSEAVSQHQPMKGEGLAY